MDTGTATVCEPLAPVGLAAAPGLVSRMVRDRRTAIATGE